MIFLAPIKPSGAKSLCNHNMAAGKTFVSEDGSIVVVALSSTLVIDITNTGVKSGDIRDHSLNYFECDLDISVRLKP